MGHCKVQRRTFRVNAICPEWGNANIALEAQQFWTLSTPYICLIANTVPCRQNTVPARRRFLPEYWGFVSRKKDSLRGRVGQRPGRPPEFSPTRDGGEARRGAASPTKQHIGGLHLLLLLSVCTFVRPPIPSLGGNPDMGEGERARRSPDLALLSHLRGSIGLDLILRWGYCKGKSTYL